MFQAMISSQDPVVIRRTLPYLLTSGIDTRAELANVGGFACNAASRRDFASFFDPRADKFTGGPHIYQQVLENIKLCEARQAANGPGIAAYFAAQ